MFSGTQANPALFPDFSNPIAESVLKQGRSYPKGALRLNRFFDKHAQFRSSFLRVAGWHVRLYHVLGGPFKLADEPAKHSH